MRVCALLGGNARREWSRLNVENDPTLSDSSEDPIYGVGVGLTLVGRLTLWLEYEVVHLETLNDTDAVWLTAAWRF